jgi:hypothetical protein
MLAGSASRAAITIGPGEPETNPAVAKPATAAR